MRGLQGPQPEGGRHPGCGWGTGPLGLGHAEMGHRPRAPGCYKLLPKYVLSLDVRLFSKLLKFLILQNIVNSTKAPSGEVAKVPFLRCPPVAGKALGPEKGPGCGSTGRPPRNSLCVLSMKLLPSLDLSFSWALVAPCLIQNQGLEGFGDRGPTALKGLRGPREQLPAQGPQCGGGDGAAGGGSARALTMLLMMPRRVPPLMYSVMKLSLLSL